MEHTVCHAVRQTLLIFQVPPLKIRGGAMLLEEQDKQQDHAHNAFPLASNSVFRTLVLAPAYEVLL